MSHNPHFARKYLREEVLPTSYCSGCGLGTIMNSFLKAAAEMGHNDLNKFVFCSGIGCSAWMPSPYFQGDTIHTTHGRSLTVALGLKLVRPELKVVVFGGDGDMAGIGLNHLVQSARRNLDVTVIMANNMIYGQTGGQIAPTTPMGTKTSTTPFGAFEYPLDVSKLVAAAGASYVARWTTFHVVQLKEAIKKALSKEGFSFVEAVTQCPSVFGRRIGMEDGGKMLQWFRDSSIPISKAREMTGEELVGRIIVGEFADIEKAGLLRNMKEAATRVSNVAQDR